MRKLLLFALIVMFGNLDLIATASERETKTVAVIEQASLFGDWEDIFMVYAFYDNKEIADKIVRSFAPNSERKLRVTLKEVDAELLAKLRESIKGERADISFEEMLIKLREAASRHNH